MSESKMDIDAISARCEKATPGPWFADGTCNDDESAIRYYVDEEDDDADPMLIAVTFDVFEETPDDNEANADFIAHARSDIPVLLDEVERLRAQRDAECERANRLAALVREYAQHRVWCDAWSNSGLIRCSCGLIDYTDSSLLPSGDTKGEV